MPGGSVGLLELFMDLHLSDIRTSSLDSNGLSLLGLRWSELGPSSCGALLD